MRYSKSIYIDIYRYQVFVLLGYEITEVSDELQDLGVPRDDRKDIVNLLDGGKYLGRTVFAGCGVVVYLPHFRGIARDIATLAHELLHATNGILKEVGVSPCNKSEEAYTYLLGYLTEEVLRGMEITISCPSP